MAGGLGEECRQALALTADSKDDPHEEPFQSLYAAREVWSGVKAALGASPAALRAEEDWAVLSAAVALQDGMNYVLGEEPARGEAELWRGLKLAEGVASKFKMAAVCVQLYNQLALLWGNRGDQHKALEYLLKAKAMHESHLGLPSPLTETEWLAGRPASEGEREKAFEGLHTLTLFYLAQAYGNLGRGQLSAHYCRATLSRQLETCEYDPLEWSLNAATLAQYYLGQGHFPQARHCLACASGMLGRLPPGGVAPEKEERAQADLARCWEKYCLALLCNSLERLQGSVAEVESEKLFRFEALEVAALEGAVPCVAVEGVEGARRLFRAGQDHLNAAKTFYSLNDYASDHVSIVQEHSQLFRVLAGFELDDRVRCRMLKRRLDMLAPLLEQLNPRHYLLLIRQLLYELGEVHSDLAAIKIVLASESPSPHAVAKINRLLLSGRQCFERFLATFTDQEGRALERFEEDCLRSVLCARLHMARLTGKLVSPDTPTQVSQLWLWGRGSC